MSAEAGDRIVFVGDGRDRLLDVLREVARHPYVVWYPRAFFPDRTHEYLCHWCFAAGDERGEHTLEHRADCSTVTARALLAEIGAKIEGT